MINIVSFRIIYIDDPSWKAADVVLKETLKFSPGSSNLSGEVGFYSPIRNFCFNHF